MIRTLTLYAYNPGTGSYQAPVTKPLADWGIAEDLEGSFRSQTADELTLSFPGGALTANSPFTYRSRVTLNLDGKPFFSGYITDDVRNYSGSSNASQLRLAGPWWYLENVVFQQTISIVTGSNNGSPTLTPTTFTHFTLNQSIVTSITATNGILYTPTALTSQGQIAAVLDFAKAAGAWLDYAAADLMAIPVLPRDVLNITCADAIRRQMEDVDAVCWFDHSVIPPRFHCQQRSALPAISRQLGDAAQAQGFNLKRRYDTTVPSVRIDFEQQNSDGYKVVSDIYPTPLPADALKALIVSIPIRGYSASGSAKWIRTAPVNVEDLAFWQARKPETDPTVNPNATVEYANLGLTAGSGRRRSGLPNMIIEGGYADWMGGQHAEDNVSVQATYERRATQVHPGDKVTQHTWHARIHVTDLDYPAGQLLSTVNVGSAGENIADYVGLAQVWFTDLNAPQWEGSLPLFEAVYTGAIRLGVNYNLQGGLNEYLTMNALAQEVSFASKSGGLFYRVAVGANKRLSAQQLADRLRAKRVAYITVATLAAQTAPALVALERETKQDNTSTAQPQLSQQHIYANFGGLLLNANNGSPVLALQKYDAAGNPLTPSTAGNPAGVAVADQSALKGTDGNWHGVAFREQKVCVKINGSLKQRTLIAWTSEIYQAPDDPA